MVHKNVLKALICRHCTFHRHQCYKIHQKKLRYTSARNIVHQQLRKCKREYYDSRLISLFIFPECFNADFHKITVKGNWFHICYQVRQKWIDYGWHCCCRIVQGKLVSISETIAPSMDVIEVNQKSLFFHTADCRETSRNIKNLMKPRFIWPRLVDNKSTKL